MQITVDAAKDAKTAHFAHCETCANVERGIGNQWDCAVGYEILRVWAQAGRRELKRERRNELKAIRNPGPHICPRCDREVSSHSEPLSAAADYCQCLGTETDYENWARPACNFSR